MGMFINSVPLLVEIDREKTFSENIATVQERAFAAFRHQKCHYADILSKLRKEYSFTEKLYDVTFSDQNATIAGSSDKFESVWHHNGAQTESLQVHVDDRDNGGIFRVHFDYQTEKFTERDMERMYERMMNHKKHHGRCEMIAEEIEWKEEYNVGVDFIDKAHQEFVRIVYRISINSRYKERNRWFVEEGIKFLKNYVLQHFSEEEEYMHSIGYKGIEQHKAQHSIMREKVLPRIEKHLIDNEYSEKAIDKFLEVLTLWILRHILTQDKAIGWEKASPLAI